MLVAVKEYYFCDSKIVLGQLANARHLFNDFVGVRVMEVRSKTDVGRWAYVPSEENAADAGTRGAIADTLCDVWFTGPRWLEDTVESWPVEFVQFDDIFLVSPQISQLLLLMMFHLH